MKQFGPKGPVPVPVDVLFWEHVEVVHGACWIWHGSKTVFGYGQIKSRQKKHGAHRISWEIANGPIPDGMFVCHRCDNPQCTNPDHLFLGTPKDNSRDCASKKRNRNGVCLGTKNHHAKLSEKDVLAIRSDCRSQPKIARDYGVSHVLIGKIKRREIWKHLPETGLDPETVLREHEQTA